ncbi:MAG: CAP domain-containing protein [Candidatus Falkowbacteria bacterium]|nr:CAP domain-containing protein [Candidatus Falkowbacteria bacterium]
MTKKLAKPKKFKDSDGDGLSDFDEINIFGSDPYNADSDRDGIEDGEAVLNGKDPVGGGPLKDFFIPNANNNYQPKSLNPKRLLFHAGSVLVIKLIVIILVAYYPLTAWMTPDVSAEEGRKIIALTNSLRKSLSLESLSENPKLDQAAAKKVDDMFINQYFAHVSPQNFDLERFLKLASYTNYITVGENLAMGYDNAAEVMTAWENSQTHYSNLVDPNFKEIGVALAGGTYKEQDTVFTAQYFGLQSDNSITPAPKVTIKKTVNKVFKPGEKAVLAETSEKATSTIVAAVAKPAIAVKDTKIIIDTPAGLKNDKVIKVEATLPVEVKTANIEVLNNNIEMAPISSVSSATGTAENKWVGQAVIQDDSKSVTPPIMTVGTADGNVQKLEVSNNNIQAQKTSLAAQYLLFKTHPDKGLGQIFNLSSIYFKILLGLVIIALLFSIFIHIRRQHAKLIFSGLGLILFLVLMIIF